MFAILLIEENLQKIFDTDPDFSETDKHGIEFYLGLGGQKWYYIQGWVSPRGGAPVANIIPQYSLDEGYEYDPEKIKTDWDQIVRK